MNEYSFRNGKEKKKYFSNGTFSLFFYVLDNIIPITLSNKVQTSKYIFVFSIIKFCIFTAPKTNINKDV